MGRLAAYGLLAAGPAVTFASSLRALARPGLRPAAALGILAAGATAAILLSGLVPLP